MAQDKSAEVIEFSSARTGAGGESVGEFLARTRNDAGIGLFAVSDAIKVKVDHLSAIEAMRADQLPSVPYAVGFVKAYARYLGLDADALAAQFKREISDAGGGAVVTPLETVSSPSSSFDTGEGARVASIFAIMAIILFGIWVVSQVGRDDRSAPAVDAEAPARIVLSSAPAETPRPAAPALALPSGGEGAINDSSGASAEKDGVETVEPAPGLASERAGATEEPVAQQDQVDAVTAQPASIESAPPASAAAMQQERDRVPGSSPQPDLAPVEEAVNIAPAPTISAPAAVASPTVTPEAPAPVIVSAELIRAAEPVYPNNCASGAADFESVTILFDITPAGRTANARVTSTTNACFNAAALNALGRWRFSPKTVNGEAAIDAAKRATINFRG